ncbi:putative elongator complex protein 1, partial [Oleoguttula sp. CCFEE 5521]
MHNLRNIAHGIIDFGEESAPLAATAWDPSDDSLICAFGPTENDTLLTVKRFKDADKPEDGIKIASWDAPSPNPDLPVDRVLNLHYFADAGLITLVLAGGDIVTVHEDATPDQDLIEIVGSVDAGIAAAAWSPDEELLAIATNADTVLFMTRDFESIANITLNPEDVKVSDHVSVGWGKAETQFKGRGAKALRDPTVPEHVDEGTLSDFDDGRASLTWRGDGQYVAMNSVLGSTPKRRIIRVFSREGVLESVSEAVNGLGRTVSWKPSGQLIAAVQHLADGVDVVFFERNGLRHGEFGLRLNSNELAEVCDNIDLAWNVDSTVLAISLPGRTQLWTTNNYHWYLKQEIIFAGQNPLPQLVKTTWHPEKSLRLSCSTGDRLRTLEYTLHVSRGPINAPHDTGTVAVIDGCKVKITPLRTANVPPPMAFEEVEYSDSALDVAFSCTGNEFAILHHDEVTFWECGYSAKPVMRAKHVKTVSLAALEETVAAARQLCLSPGGEALVLSSGAGSGSCRVHFVSKNSTISSMTTAAQVLSLFARSDHERIHCLDTEGTLTSVIHVSTADEVSSIDFEPLLIQLPTACPQTAIWHQDRQALAFGLS